MSRQIQVTDDEPPSWRQRCPIDGVMCGVCAKGFCIEKHRMAVRLGRLAKKMGRKQTRNRTETAP